MSIIYDPLRLIVMCESMGFMAFVLSLYYTIHKYRLGLVIDVQTSALIPH